MKMTPVNDMAGRIASSLESAMGRLREVLPDAEIQHVGAPAIPGALTKGDLDLVIRIDCDQFPAVVATLSPLFDRKQTENCSSTFASFGDDDGCDLPLGVQVVVRGAEEDVFLCLRDHLLANRDILEKYNRIKSQHAGDAADGYWKAKHAFFGELLAELCPK